MVKLFVEGIVSMVKLFGSKPSIFKVISTVLSFLPSLIQQAVDFSKADAQQKFDAFLGCLEQYTDT